MDGKFSESLADYVRRVRNGKGLSQPEVERRSAGGITDGYISQIENGYIKNVSLDKLRALAKGLGVPEQEIFDVALGRSASTSKPDADAARLVSYYEDSPPDIRQQMLLVCEALWRDAKSREQVSPQPKKKRA